VRFTAARLPGEVVTPMPATSSCSASGLVRRQAAFRGHSTYDNNSGPRPGAVTGYALNEWLVCGTGRFTFRAATTPKSGLDGFSYDCAQSIMNLLLFG
jgi:hypothetical protein